MPPEDQASTEVPADKTTDVASRPTVASGAIPLTDQFEAAHAHAPLVPPRGGDFHDAFPIEDGSGKVGFVMGDVVGHGAEAAAHAESLKNAISGVIAEGVSPSDALGYVNAASEMDPNFQGFATVIAGTIDPNSGTIEYASGGHEPAIVAAPKSGDRPAASADAPIAHQELTATGPPVGAFAADEVAYGTERATLPPGGTLLLYTDGVTDARRGRNMLGIERLRAWLISCLYLPPLRLVRKLLGLVRAFTGGTGPRDDVALLAVRRVDNGEKPEQKNGAE